MRVVATDYDREHIRVNAIVPGCTEPLLVTAILRDDSAYATGPLFFVDGVMTMAQSGHPRSA